MSIVEKIEDGVMIMKDGKGWGVNYKDGQFTSYGWIDPVEAELHNPVFCKKPTDVTYEGSPYIKELKDAEIVPVQRKTIVEIKK